MNSDMVRRPIVTFHSRRRQHPTGGTRSARVPPIFEQSSALPAHLVVFRFLGGNARGVRRRDCFRTRGRIVDIAPNAAAGDEKVLDSAALTVLKNTDSLVHVVRAFDDENVMHPLDSVDAARDCQVLEEELMLTDLVVIENRLQRMEKDAERMGADAIINVRLATSMVVQGAAELLAYGTAVKFK